MANHSRHHHRSFLSGIREWMGFSHSAQKAHHTHFKTARTGEGPDTSGQAKNSFSGELNEPIRVHQRYTRVRSRHQRQKSKKGWMQQLKHSLASLIPFSQKHRRKSFVSSHLSGLKKLVGDGSDHRKSELFYKLEKDGEYKVILANPVTLTGINEEGIATKVPGVERISIHRQKRPQDWNRNFTKSIQNFKRILIGKRKHRRYDRPSFHAGVETAETVSKPAQKGYQPEHSNGLKHNRFSFIELINSWFKLSFVLKLLSSAGLFMTAYVIAWLTYSLAVMFIASFYEIYGVLYYFEVMWPDSNSSPLWNANNAFTIAFAGPFISLAMSLVYFTILLKVKNLGTQLKTLVFWLFLLSMAHFAGAFAAGIITSQGIAYVMDGEQIAFIFRLLISILSLGAMAWIGWKYAFFILEIRPVRKHGNNIPLILINRMVLPCLLGIVLLIIIKIPIITPQHSNIWYSDVIILLTVLFAVIPSLFNKKLRPVQHPSKTVITRDRTARAFFAIILSLTILILYRLSLSTGLYIYMKFAIHISSF